MTNSIYKVVSKRKTSIIRNTKIILNLPNNHIVTYNDVNIMKNIISNHIHIDNLSPSEIAKKYNIESNSYHIFISKTLDIKLKNHRDARNNYLEKMGLLITDCKKLYWNSCQFNFSPYQEPYIEGFLLLKTYSFSTPQDKEPNKIYLHRDHMVSISYGYENNIPPEHISHPANCEILTEKDNISKGSGCSITYEHLLFRIENWNKFPIDTIRQNIEPRSKIHRTNISKSLREYHQRKNTN